MLLKLHPLSVQLWDSSLVLAGICSARRIQGVTPPNLTGKPVLLPPFLHFLACPTCSPFLVMGCWVSLILDEWQGPLWVHGTGNRSMGKLGTFKPKNTARYYAGISGMVSAPLCLLASSVPFLVLLLAFAPLQAYTCCLTVVAVGQVLLSKFQSLCVLRKGALFW